MAASKSITARISSEGPIPFPVFAPLHDRTEPITQLELELFLSLRNRLKQLESQVATEEAGLKSRLEAGATVDPGVHVIELKESFDARLRGKKSPKGSRADSSSPVTASVSCPRPVRLAPSRWKCSEVRP